MTETKKGTQRIYSLPVETTEWKFDGATEIQFNWEYDDGSDAAARALREGQEAAVGRQRAARLVARAQSRQSDGAQGRVDLDLRHRHLEQDERQGAGLAAPRAAGQLDQPVHAWRAGRADRHRQDRRHRARHERQVLRRDPGDGRGAPCRGLQAAAAREVRRRLSDQPGAADAARADPDRPALGHDLSRHAGADRGAGAGGLPVDPRQGGQHAGRGGECLRHAGRGAARLVRPAGAARILSAAHATPSATSARSSSSRRSISCATASTSRKSGSGSACPPRCWTRSTTIPSR